MIPGNVAGYDVLLPISEYRYRYRCWTNFVRISVSLAGDDRSERLRLRLQPKKNNSRSATLVICKVKFQHYCCLPRPLIVTLSRAETRTTAADTRDSLLGTPSAQYRPLGLSEGWKTGNQEQFNDLVSISNLGISGVCRYIP